MSLLLGCSSRLFRASCTRPYYLYNAARCQSTQFTSGSQQFQGDYPPVDNKSPSRYRYYVLSIAAGALLGTIYTLRQSRKYEGLMPEYISNPELMEQKAMEARPLPPPVTKHVTFDQPPREHFPFKITLYQYITWSVRVLSDACQAHSRTVLVRFAVKCVPT